jgi:integrase
MIATEFERLTVARAGESDFVLVNLFREPVGAPMTPEAVNELGAALCRRAGLARSVSAHQLRHAFGSNLMDAGGSIDEVQELLGHASLSSTQVYVHQGSGIASDGRESAGWLAGEGVSSLARGRRVTALTCWFAMVVPSDA